MSTVPHQSMQWKGIELKQCRVRWLGAAVWGIAAQLRLMVPYLSCYVHDWNVINLIKLNRLTSTVNAQKYYCDYKLGKTSMSKSTI